VRLEPEIWMSRSGFTHLLEAPFFGVM
jgi:hypothetical protein